MRRLGGLAVGFLLLAGGALIGVYGLFAVLYNGDCRGDCGDVYVTRFGRQIDANLVGGIALAIALVAIAMGVWLLKRSRAA